MMGPDKLKVSDRLKNINKTMSGIVTRLCTDFRDNSHCLGSRLITDFDLEGVARC